LLKKHLFLLAKVYSNQWLNRLRIAPKYKPTLKSIKMIALIQVTTMMPMCLMKWIQLKRLVVKVYRKLAINRSHQPSRFLAE